MNTQDKKIIREALKFARQKQELFWAFWAADKMRPSELLDTIDHALAALEQLDAPRWEPIDVSRIGYNVYKQTYLLDGKPINWYAASSPVRLCVLVEGATK
jgi:hypothetical protein